jgi:hypothetical protein
MDVSGGAYWLENHSRIVLTSIEYLSVLETPYRVKTAGDHIVYGDNSAGKTSKAFLTTTSEKGT